MMPKEQAVINDLGEAAYRLAMSYKCFHINKETYMEQFSEILNKAVREVSEQQVDPNFNFEDEKWLTDESDYEKQLGIPTAPITGHYSVNDEIIFLEKGKSMVTHAQLDLNLNCKSVQKRLATSWGYTKSE